MRSRSSEFPIVFVNLAYTFGVLATFARLTFFDGVVYSWWNWLFILPFNSAAASMWPFYWVGRGIYSLLFG